MAERESQKAPVHTHTEAPADLDKLVKGLSEARPKIAQVAGKTDPGRQAYWDEVIVEFLKRVADGSLSYDEDLATVLDQQIAALDARLSAQMDAVLHNEKFQKLEASWRGLTELVRKTDSGANIKIRVLPVKRAELQKDLVGSTKLERTSLYRKIYKTGIGTLHGEPVGLIVADFAFTAARPDVQLLDRLGQLAQQSLAPVVAAASPEMFEEDSFARLAGQDDIHARFENPQYAEWRGLRDKEHAKFLGLCAPRMLVRGAHEVMPEQGFAYHEDVSTPDGNGFLWGNAAYAFAERVHRSFADYGWCLAMRGVEGGGKIEDLPVLHYQSDRGDTVQWPVDVALDHKQDMQMAELGFIPLVHMQNQNKAVFIAAPSVHQRVGFVKDKDNSREFLSSQLPYTFVLSRFGHHVKHMLIDRIGTSIDRLGIERFLHDWIHQYVEDSDNVSLEVRAKKPLRKASVVVLDEPGRPGAYRVELTLQPHFLLEDVTVQMSLSADIEDKQG
jgi:type VI secretion system protein ImpC